MGYEVKFRKKEKAKSAYSALRGKCRSRGAEADLGSLVKLTGLTLIVHDESLKGDLDAVLDKLHMKETRRQYKIREI